MATKRFTVRGVRIEVEEHLLTAPLEQALATGGYERAEADALEQLLEPDDVYLELGGGVGFMSTLAWRRLGVPGRIHVFEANPELMPVMRRTWEAHGVDARAHHAMLGHGKGERAFHVARAFWASSGHVDYGAGRTIQVEQRDFGRQLAKTGATFVMMDIEGGEVELLDRSLPEPVRVVVAEYHPRIVGAARVAALWDNLERQGFRHVRGAGDEQVRAYRRG